MDAFVDKWDNKYINFLTDIYDTMRQGADTRIFFYEVEKFFITCITPFYYYNNSLKSSNISL